MIRWSTSEMRKSSLTARSVKTKWVTMELVSIVTNMLG